MAINKIDLLIIDPQNDFCDPKGSLFVVNADKDMETLAKFIKRVHPRLNDIHVTLDSHHRSDVAHPLWWKDKNGQHPVIDIPAGKYPVLVTSKDIDAGTWMPTIAPKRTIEYVRELEKRGKFNLVIWPEHCLIGSWGHNVYAPVAEALAEFEKTPGFNVDYVTKGSNPYTEHYSVFRAEVPDQKDPSTQLNSALVDVLQNKTDMIYVAGEALSHCVASSIRDLADAFGDDQYLARMTLLTDCMSNVPGFEKQGDDFVQEMVRRGMKTAKSTDVLK